MFLEKRHIIFSLACLERFDVLSTKVDIRLAKAEPIHSRDVQFSKDNPVPLKVNAPVIGVQRPSYPSSKPKWVDWDKLEAQEKDEKLDGDAALNKFFQDIFKDADEDTRRAMRKSFCTRWS
ncbi:putative SGS domain-containing protein [Rosa chinensis]|uniref:Putative SGS domain-containing protein n=1 Tax=Rosa chinensis TaxID=74649 RepID=A0A2P6SNE9_ROSCH|nr:putative SGS domain-containing protein [Rosa chinensis]